MQFSWGGQYTGYDSCLHWEEGGGRNNCATITTAFLLVLIVEEGTLREVDGNNEHFYVHS